MIFPLDSDARSTMVLCEVPTLDGKPLRYAVPSDLCDLLKRFDGSRETSDVIVIMQRSCGSKYSARKLEQLVEDFLVPKGILKEANLQRGPATGRARRDKYLYLKTTLLPARIVYPFARVLGGLFSSPILYAWVGMFISIHILFYRFLARQPAMDLNRLNGKTLLLVIAITTFGGLVHEFGHAVALVRYGGRRPDIGWAVYLIFSVFFTDLSEAWHMSRKQRAVVDLGGIYFQSFFAFLLLIVFWITGSSLYFYCFLFTDFQIASSLNPFFRMDGYWVVTDLFGFLDLRRQATALVRKTLGIDNAADRNLVDVSHRSTLGLGIYVCLATIFFFYTTKVMCTRIVLEIVASYPASLRAFWTSVSSGPLNLVAAVSSLAEVLWRSLVLVGILISVYRLISWLVTALAKASRAWAFETKG